VGPSGSDKSALARQSCPQAAPDPVQVASRAVRSKTSRFFRGNLADIDLIRSQAPLPETADELCAVARSAGAPEGAVHLGAKATETTVKALSAGGVLTHSRVVHFATHGMLASETGLVGGSKAEPALLLTPPVKATPWCATTTSSSSALPSSTRRPIPSRWWKSSSRGARSTSGCTAMSY
jgi:hypothetical protein